MENTKAKTVKVFSTPTCPYCVMLKSFLKDKNVSYQDVNVAVDQKAANEMVQKSGEMGVPQMWVDGQVIIGFDRSQIDYWLQLK